MRLHPALSAVLLLAACGAPASNRPGGAPAPDEPSVAPGTVLPFGAMARACGVSGAALGTPVEAAAGFAISDTAPGSAEPRTHFITGFADGCPRQVTAAVAVFGDVGTREMMAATAPGGAADPTGAAYEAIKAEECGVAAGQPCGAALAQLAADTVFVSLYPAFGSDESREVLLHRGEVAAADF